MLFNTFDLSLTHIRLVSSFTSAAIIILQPEPFTTRKPIGSTLRYALRRSPRRPPPTRSRCSSLASITAPLTRFPRHHRLLNTSTAIGLSLFLSHVRDSLKQTMTASQTMHLTQVSVTDLLVDAISPRSRRTCFSASTRHFRRGKSLVCVKSSALRIAGLSIILLVAYSHVGSIRARDMSFMLRVLECILATPVSTSYACGASRLPLVLKFRPMQIGSIRLVFTRTQLLERCMPKTKVSGSCTTRYVFVHMSWAHILTFLYRHPVRRSS